MSGFALFGERSPFSPGLRLSTLSFAGNGGGTLWALDVNKAIHY